MEILGTLLLVVSVFILIFVGWMVFRKKEPAKKYLIPLGAAIILFGIGYIFVPKETEPATKQTATSSESVEESVEKLSLEEQSKQFLIENGGIDNDINHLVDSYLAIQDKELKQMVAVGHAKGTQIKDDFDVIGSNISATGMVISFEDIYVNTYNNRGKKNGVKAEERTDFFSMYTGNKPINDFEYIAYDPVLHKDRDKNEFFLGVYPDEVNHFVLVDLDSEHEIGLGQTITIQGRISNFVVTEDFDSNENSAISIDMAKIIEK